MDKYCSALVMKKFSWETLSGNLFMYIHNFPLLFLLHPTLAKYNKQKEKKKEKLIKAKNSFFG